MFKQAGNFINIILRLIFVSSLTLLSLQGTSQQQKAENNYQKGKIYFYWGWNRGMYTNSDINFEGSNYNFMLHHVSANDRQSLFSFDTYFNPAWATIPQYNFRVGYFFKENWDISFGIDHMKYVVQQDQLVNISGNINIPESNYNDTYLNESIQIEPKFLKFEHSDGLNYINVELRRSEECFQWKEISVYFIGGAGVGFLLPKTNVTLLGNERNDNFHLSGYGINALVGINLTFFNKFFIQTEMKGGFINMPDIRTTKYDEDRASQHFLFAQYNVVFGATINLKNNKD